MKCKLPRSITNSQWLRVKLPVPPSFIDEMQVTKKHYKQSMTASETTCSTFIYWRGASYQEALQTVNDSEWNYLFHFHSLMKCKLSRSITNCQWLRVKLPVPPSFIDEMQVTKKHYKLSMTASETTCSTFIHWWNASYQEALQTVNDCEWNYLFHLHSLMRC